MKRSLKLFNKKGKKPRRRQDVPEYDEEFEDDYYEDEEFEEDYGDEDYAEDDDRAYEDDYADDRGEDDYPEERYADEDYRESKFYSRKRHGDFDHELREDDDFDLDYRDDDDVYEDEEPEDDRYEDEDRYQSDDVDDRYEDDEEPELAEDESDNIVAFPGRSESAEDNSDDLGKEPIEESSINTRFEFTERVSEHTEEPSDDDFADMEIEYKTDSFGAEAPIAAASGKRASEEFEDEDYDPEFEEDYGDEDADNRYADDEDGRYEDDEDYRDEDDRYDDDEDYRDEDDRYSDEDDRYYEDDRYDEDDYEGEDYDGDEDDYAYAAAGAKSSRGKRADRHSGRSSRRDKKHDRRREREGAGAKILEFIKNTSFAERAAAVVAILLVVGGIVTMNFYSKALGRTAEINSFAEVGADMEFGDVIGSSGLLAVADAERARAMAAGMIAEEEEEEEEVADDAQGVTIKMTLTTIKSDMKIKFINSETNKLVANVPFVVSVVTPDGTKVTYDDHDKDGIIYKNNLTAGKYKVTPQALPAEFENYNVDLGTQSLTIKDTVETKVVDVSNEIKKESQVNAAKEDTAVQDVIESALTDTVEWVDSNQGSSTSSSDPYTYEPVDKSNVADPNTTAMIPAGSVRRLSASRSRVNDASKDASSEATSETSVEGGEGASTEGSSNASTEASSEASSAASSENSSSSDSSSAASNASSNQANTDTSNTGASTGSSTPSDSSSAASGSNSSSEPTVKLSADNITVAMGETGKKVKVNTADATAIAFRSLNPDVVEVNSSTGELTPKKVDKGKIEITASNYLKTEIEVTVTAANGDKALEMKFTKVTLVQGQKIKAEPKTSGASCTYTSDNTSIATVAEDGTITGVAVGPAKITVKNKTNEYKDAYIEVNVVSNKTELKDKSGNTLYVKNANGGYDKATYEDYYKGVELYLRKEKTGPDVRHGWWTIDGKTYYYDKNGNAVTGEQVIKGAKYSFGSDGALSASSGTLGIDVSKWNGNIDWNKVKSSGVNFVIIRCGYRGSSAGALIEDPKFRANIKGAQAAGLRVGVYFFSQAVNEVEAVEEASMCINLCKGYSLSFPIYIDVEGSNGRGDTISASQRTANIKAFCGTIQNGGYRAGVYSNKTWFTKNINTASLTNYKIWLAQYAANVSYTATRYDMWQYTSKGSVSGISGNVDMNILYN